MHIGFDISQTGGTKAGCGYYAHAMIGAMIEHEPRHRYSLYPSFGDFWFDPAMPERNPYPGRDVRYGPRHRTLEEARRFWTQEALDAALGYPDVVHANNFWCPTQLRAARVVYTLYDLSFLVDPSWTTEVNRAGCSDGVARAAKNADWIVSISAASRAHFLSVFPGFPEDRVRVIPACSRFSPSTPGRAPATLSHLGARGFWLSVGTIEPRKNQRRIAEAYARYLAAGGPRKPLVFAGGQGWRMDDFQAYLGQLGVEGDVILAGYVDDDELAWLYRNCEANLYVSLFEGFGLPVLEGMQFGAPTITSNTTSMPEVAGEAAIAIDPLDVEALTRAMLRISGSDEERARRSAASLERAAQFDWRRGAGALLSLYEEAVGAPKRAITTGLGGLRRHFGKLYERTVRSLRRP